MDNIASLIKLIAQVDAEKATKKKALIPEFELSDFMTPVSVSGKPVGEKCVVFKFGVMDAFLCYPSGISSDAFYKVEVTRGEKPRAKFRSYASTQVGSVLRLNVARSRVRVFVTSDIPPLNELTFTVIRPDVEKWEKIMKEWDLYKKWQAVVDKTMLAGDLTESFELFEKDPRKHCWRAIKQEVMDCKRGEPRGPSLFIFPHSIADDASDEPVEKTPDAMDE